MNKVKGVYKDCKAAVELLDIGKKPHVCYTYKQCQKIRQQKKTFISTESYLRSLKYIDTGQQYMMRNSTQH